MKLAVDVGCGTGMSTRNLFGKFGSVLGVDLSEAMVEEARNCWKDHKNAEFQVAKAEQIPVENNSAQVILVGRAIHYFDQKTFFQEVDRILVGSAWSLSIPAPYRGLGSGAFFTPNRIDKAIMSWFTCDSVRNL